MRKVVYGAACSLDGFIAAADGSIDWLHFSKDVTALMSEFWKGTDTLVMGRKTWEVAVTMGSWSGGELSGIRSYVFSRTLSRIDHPGVELVTADAGNFVRDLRRRPGKNICVFGGGDFARSLFEADVIDEVGLNVHPVLLGAGIPLFRDAGKRFALRLTECRQLHGDCVLMNYAVKHARQASSHRTAGRAPSYQIS